MAFGELDGRISDRVEGLRSLCRTASDPIPGRPRHSGRDVGEAGLHLRAGGIDSRGSYLHWGGPGEPGIVGDVPAYRVRGGRGCAERGRAGPSRLRRSGCLVCRAAAPGSALIAARRPRRWTGSSSTRSTGPSYAARDGSGSTCRQRVGPRAPRANSSRREGTGLSASYVGSHERGHGHDHDERAALRGGAGGSARREALLSMTRSTRSSTATNAISGQNGARVVAHAWVDPEYRARLLADGAARSRSSVTAASWRHDGRRREHGCDPQRRRLHAVLLLPVACAGPAAVLVQEPRVPCPYGGRAARCATGVRPRASRRDRDQVGTRRARSATSCATTAGGTEGGGSTTSRRWSPATA